MVFHAFNKIFITPTTWQFGGCKYTSVYLFRCPNMAVESADTPADNEEEEDEMDKKAKNVISAEKSKRKVK